MIECFAMFSFSSPLFPQLFNPAPPTSPPSPTAEPVAMGRIVSGQYNTGQTKADYKKYNNLY